LRDAIRRLFPQFELGFQVFASQGFDVSQHSLSLRVQVGKTELFIGANGGLESWHRRVVGQHQRVVTPNSAGRNGNIAVP
jgi:hypothetical protein